MTVLGWDLFYVLTIAVEANPTAILDIQNSETSYNLICHLETNIECVEPLHVHHITEKDLKLLQQGGFIWMFYIPRGSFKDLVNSAGLRLQLIRPFIKTRVREF